MSHIRCHDSCCQPDPEIAYILLHRRTVGATRKAHRCSDCHREIPPGSPAVTTAELIDGEFWSGYQHDMNGMCTEEVP